ncbi:flagellar export chaperone FliS [Telmatospirillum siberiense]|uniref:Flagellar export chaperone FliS n=1 Tax=Telmatospirillum siberiense TaxID=382514 RepID=A0A2N3Q008_9PROT|nr:flagellar export chaperone FliS [Telmatospirillum siberiense]PKU25998.1 flagellar export chaperone FliS [Telmatospirillum siberiense]
MSTTQTNPSVTAEPSTTAVVQLYDTVLLHVSRAAEAAHKGDFQAQFDEVMSATRIIDGLNRCLDMAQGGQVAVNLREMYEAVSRTLLRSVGKPSAEEACDKLISAVRDMRNAWAEISGLPPIAAQ